MTRDYRDLVITDLANEVAELRAANKQLIDLVGDVAFDSAVWQQLYEREFICRVHADATIRRLQRLVYQQRMAA